MDEKTIKESYASICNLLKERRLKEALIQTEAFLYQCPDWSLRNTLEQLQLSYKYMLDYMRQGIADPQRTTLYSKLVADTWQTADRARRILLGKASARYYYEQRRTAELLPTAFPPIGSLLPRLEAFADDLAVNGLLSPKHEDEVLQRHEEALRQLFATTWISECWTKEERNDALSYLTSELLPAEDVCLFVSAVTLALTECFDMGKLMWLLDAYNHTNVRVSQRALVGVILAAHLHNERLALYPDFLHRLSLMNEDPAFGTEVARAYRQLLLCQETEKIDKKMREEIIPEMLKSVSSMKGLRFGPDETDEEGEGHNPDWESLMEQPGLSDKLREMHDLQLEGADVYMNTFASLKGFPFFRELHHWFYPFSKQQPDVRRLLREQGTQEPNKLLDLFFEADAFNDSDKYSFFFVLHQLPPAQREEMMQQLREQHLSDLIERTDADLTRRSRQPETVGRQYLHALYRFFKLNTRRHEFPNIFADRIELHLLPGFSAILAKPEALLPLADFHLSKERWVEAIDIYDGLKRAGMLQEQPAETFQKYGYALQQTHAYEEAISAYRQADTRKPNNLWTNRQLATCYRQTADFEEALTYYKLVEQVEPESAILAYRMGSCLVELERYAEALNYFFKADYLRSHYLKAWRGIGWCSFLCGKHEQAMRYYDQVLEEQPQPADYLNAGHVAWALGQSTQALGLYQQALAGCRDREEFLAKFYEDRKVLQQQGIREEELPLMLDLL